MKFYYPNSIVYTSPATTNLVAHHKNGFSVAITKTIAMNSIHLNTLTNTLMQKSSPLLPCASNILPALQALMQKPSPLLPFTLTFQPTLQCKNHNEYHITTQIMLLFQSLINPTEPLTTSDQNPSTLSSQQRTF